MPRDDSGPPSTFDPSSQNGKNPLKRGDACLYCRKRRIRCSAEKPTCQHCTKLKRECIYDAGKPVSRVKQLEDKVAELEGLLKVGPEGAVINALNNAGSSQGRAQGSNGSQGNGMNGNSGVGQPPPLTHHSSSGTSSTNGTMPGGPSTYSGPGGTDSGGMSNVQETPQFNFQGTMGYDGSTNFNTSDPWGTSSSSTGYTGRLQQQQQPAYGYSMVDPKAVEQFDFSTLDPSFMNLINSLGATSTGTDIPPAQSYSDLSTTQPMFDAGMGGSNGMEVDFNGPSGLTPFLDPTNGQGLGNFTSFQTPSTSINPPPPSNQTNNTYASSSMQPISIQPTPSPFSAKVSYHAYVTEVASTPSSQNNSSTTPPDQGMGETREEKYIREENIGNADVPQDRKGPMNSGDLNGGTRPQEGYGNGWKSWIENRPLPPEFIAPGDTSGLMGGWFDPTDLPRVARDHL